MRGDFFLREVTPGFDQAFVCNSLLDMLHFHDVVSGFLSLYSSVLAVPAHKITATAKAYLRTYSMDVLFVVSDGCGDS